MSQLKPNTLDGYYNVKHERDPEYTLTRTQSVFLITFQAATGN